MNRQTAAFAVCAALLVTAPAFAHDEHQEGHRHDMGAIGEPGQASQAARSVTITMSDDMRFTPAALTVKQGETIRFVIRNTGQVRHEFVLGDAQALKAHYQMMLEMPEMRHTDPNMLSLEPGQSGELVWHFTHPGKVEFACLQPGHFDAGMVGAVTVSARQHQH